MALKNMGLVPLIIDINDDIIKPLFAKEGDYRSRGISLQILNKGKEIDTTGIIVEFFAKPRDGKVYVVEATPVDATKGKYEIVYPSSILQPGIVKCEIRLVKMTDDEIDEIISTKSFNLKVYETIADEDIFEGIDIEPITEILVQAARNEEERIAAENERIQAENTRIQNENERKNNEQIRQQKEDERQQNEITRQTNEQTRQQNEQQRIDLYNALKDLDVSQYELRLQKLEHDTSVEEFILEEAYGSVISLPSNVVNGQINEVTIGGLTVTNILGDLGDFEDLNKWSKNLNYGTLDNTKKVFGNYSLRQIKNNENGYLYKDNIPLKKDRYYFLSLYRFVEVPSAGLVGINLFDNNTFTNTQIITTNFVNTDNLNVWERIGYKFQSTKDICRFMIGGGGLATTTYNIDGLMLIEITEEEYNNLSVEELMQKYQYINGTKSTFGAIRLKNVGKNLFDGKWLPVGTRYSPNALTPFRKEKLENASGILEPIKIQQGKSYSVSCTGAMLDGIYWYDENGYYINRVFSYINITPPNNAKYLAVNIRDITTNIENVKLQIEVNNTTTEYEPYKESTMYLVAKDEEGNILELHSLPNGVKDEIRLADGKAIIRTSKLTLDGTESGWQTQPTSNQKVLSAYISVANLQSLAGHNLSGQKDSVILEGFTTGIVGLNNTDNINTDNINTVNYNATGVNLIIDIALERLETPDISGFKKWLGEKQPTLIYQLAEPIEVPIEVFGNLQSYEKGTIYVDTIMPRVDFYTSEGIVLEENEPAIKEIDKLYLVNKENGYLTELDTSKAFIFPDGKGFTHPDLYNDALVDWDYIPDVESTNPAISMKLPTNLKASINSALEGIKDLYKQTYNLNIRVTANRQEINNDFNKHKENVDDYIEHLIKNRLLGNKTKYIAHRGASRIAPENTLPAYEKAGELGFWGAECDVLVSADGVWVLHHDDTVDRMTNGTGYVSSLTLAQLKALTIDAGNNIAYYPNLKIPTLEEYLAVCRKWGIVPVIEIKPATYTNTHYDIFVDLLKKMNLESKAIVISFNQNVLTEIRNRSKYIQLQLVSSSFSNDLIDFAKALGNTMLDLKHDIITQSIIEECHTNDIMVNAWTVNDYNIAKTLRNYGVDFITTDFIVD